MQCFKIEVIYIKTFNGKFQKLIDLRFGVLISNLIIPDFPSPKQRNRVLMEISIESIHTDCSTAH